jgi:hypothetical protein
VSVLPNSLTNERVQDAGQPTELDPVLVQRAVEARREAWRSFSRHRLHHFVVFGGPQERAEGDVGVADAIVQLAQILFALVITAVQLEIVKETKATGMVLIA